MSKTRLLIPGASIAMIALGVWLLWSLLLGVGPQELPIRVGKVTRPPEGGRKLEGLHEFPVGGLEVPGDWMWQARQVQPPFPILGGYRPALPSPPAFSTFEWHLDQEGYIVRGHSEGEWVVKTVWNRPAFERDFKIVREEGGYSRDGHPVRFLGRPKLRLNDPRWLSFLKRVAAGVASNYTADLWPVTVDSEPTGVIDCVLFRQQSAADWRGSPRPWAEWTRYSLYRIDDASEENFAPMIRTGSLELPQFGTSRDSGELLKWIGNTIDLINNWKGSPDPVLTESAGTNLVFWRNELERQEMAYGKRAFDRQRMIQLTEEALRLLDRKLEYRRKVGLPIDYEILDQHTAYQERDTTALARWKKEEGVGGQ